MASPRPEFDPQIHEGTGSQSARPLRVRRPVAGVSKTRRDSDHGPHLSIGLGQGHTRTLQALGSRAPHNCAARVEVVRWNCRLGRRMARSEEHTSELQSLMRISYAVFCLKKKNTNKTPTKQS